MTDSFAFLVITFIAILGFEAVNGWTDAPNAVATVVSTRVLQPDEGGRDGGRLQPARRSLRHGGRGDHRQGDRESRRDHAGDDLSVPAWR